MGKNSSLIPHAIFSMQLNKYGEKPFVTERQQGDQIL